MTRPPPLAWTQFVRRVQEQLAADDSCIDFHAPFDREHALTEQIVGGVRQLFKEAYPALERTIHHHVLYRNGKKLKTS